MDECGGCVKKSTKCQSLQTTSLDSLVHHKLPTVNFFDLFFFSNVHRHLQMELCAQDQ